MTVTPNESHNEPSQLFVFILNFTQDSWNMTILMVLNKIPVVHDYFA